MLKLLDLFSGIGGFSLGFERTGGFKTVAFCEIDPVCRRILKKHWPDVPAFEDIKNMEAVSADIITGGFPCQDISLAGHVVSQREGLDGKRSGLWSELCRLIGDIRPRYAIVENVTDLLTGPPQQPGRWFGRLLADLASIGYDAEWHYISASSVGAPQNRGRVWIIAYPSGSRVERLVKGKYLEKIGPWGWRGKEDLRFIEGLEGSDRWPIPLIRGVDDGISGRVDRIRPLGNSIIPQIAQAIAQEILEVEHGR